jgi:hypothetical protein
MKSFRDRLRDLIREEKDRRQGGDQTFRLVTVRGNSPEERALEVNRLKQAGQMNNGDWVIEEPLEPGRPVSEIGFMRVSDLDRILREIDGKTRGLPGA